MKKVLFTAILAIATSVSANAQWKVGADLGLQVPIGTYGDAYGLGFGFAVSGEYLVTESIGVGLQIGYFSIGSGSGLYDTGMSLVPITATGKYYFMTEGLKPYAGLDLGLYRIGFDYGFGLGVASETKFGLAPVAGVQYEFTDNWALDGNLKYNYIAAEGKAFTTFGINVGVVYTFK